MESRMGWMKGGRSLLVTIESQEDSWAGIPNSRNSQKISKHWCLSFSFKNCFFVCRFRVVIVSSLSHVWLFVIPGTEAPQASLSITNSWSLPKLMSNDSVMPSNHLILCRPCLLLPSIFSRIRVFSNESFLHIRWPKYWSFSFSIRPSNEYSGLIAFRIDWFDLLAVQGTLKSLFQHHSSKASILQQALNFLYSPTLTSIHDYWKSHSFD